MCTLRALRVLSFISSQAPNLCRQGLCWALMPVRARRLWLKEDERYDVYGMHPNVSGSGCNVFSIGFRGRTDLRGTLRDESQDPRYLRTGCVFEGDFAEVREVDAKNCRVADREGRSQAALSAWPGLVRRQAAALQLQKLVAVAQVAMVRAADV